ncbi:molecular chaperone GrpE [Cryptococcus wingfieldii CBS 7118]|uniref:GrpE protein homolog, mitochondrial n=1 Tax=Cryptococcus wingfieldii CBS 7118 TaxID=1295528 RepID=A0A1E3JM58_9TREE|nr:molecular chaperone GrpE [Cryptococcus wingfieldii CBS 7118]ODO01959.1 molecular chaperone GrpE [Cryptococcus wingfieldii CBS 7118]
MSVRSFTGPLRSLSRSALPRPAPASGARLFPAQLRAYSDAAPAEPTPESARLTELETANKELEESVKEMKRDMQYLRADLQTANRRTAEEKAKASEFAITSFARALLDTADVLTTALKHVPQDQLSVNKDLASLHQGVQLTHKALLQTFEQHGVKQLGELRGEQFDPNQHEALFTVPQAVAPKKANGDSHGPNEIFDVSKEGWTIGQRVLRPAQVGVVAPE